MDLLDEVRFDEEGLEGDLHRGTGLRSVLIEDAEVLRDLDLAPGQIKENVTVEGIGVNALEAGTRLSLGEVVVEITKNAGPCERMEEIRPGLRAELEGRRGVLARVIAPGVAHVGDPVEVHEREVAPA